MNELKYKALALDLDGTLTDSNKKIPQENKEAIWKAIDKGVIIILASGRPTMGITGIAKELELDKRGGIIINEDGLTSRKGVYAGGDAVTGAATVISAMGAGKLAAKGIDDFISNKA